MGGGVFLGYLGIEGLLFLLAHLSNLDCDTSTLIPNSQSDFFSCSSADCKAR